ncbi:hypothetical protein [Nannocystis pusilla]|uniref:hypothetical protein n=1 Tax=Nannocystis pusilla TaxID=889268 RepID=UPI003DA5CE15
MSKRTWPEGHAKDALEETTAPGAASASLSVGSVEETVVRPDSLDRVRTVGDVREDHRERARGGRRAAAGAHARALFNN